MDRKQRKVQWVTARRNRRKYHLNKYKIKNGCNYCGYNKSPYALDFDHIDPRTKIKPVSRLTLGSLKNLMGEVRKCQVLCKNCHAIKSSVLELHRHGQGHNVY